ncbi:flagellar hook-associated protein FlgL [Paraglaciecola chathamensis]|uniref:Flagellar hook-associated protein 3 n=2 Tax=Paraglaciecola chathamensis TaxID=368405 RepID=A0A8H9I837_9ALTE|nr:MULTISPECIES: flagellar hook-associated protein FlgL [Paraglaciecola]MBU3019396.1 flagellar hook-associated protein FlgL [Paraglaciecola agarilytica]GAC11341.1 flagellar hook-associated protein 3 FlgL [Paraglaciecola chathamensis S18K6]GGZ56647.1 flagellar hook-associated protein 3 [Paraglaciecola oceanifecundans]
MRISTGQLYDRSIRAVLDNQDDLSDVQQQLSTGKKLLRPSDDPVGSAQVIRLTEEIDLINQYNKNNNLLTNSIEQEETILGNVTDNIQRARQLMIQAGNGILDVDDRKAIAIEIGQIRDQIFDAMNSQSANGEYIFAGYQSATPAFSYTAGASGNKYAFEGDEGLNEIRISNTFSLAMNNSGQTVFEDVYARLDSQITSSSGVASASTRISTQNEFDQFHSQNYDPVVAANNEFQISISAADQVTITNVGTGAVVGTQPFISGEPFEFKGQEFTIEGVVGDTVNYALQKPEKKNIAETLNDFYNSLNDENISDQDYAQAISDALIGVDNSLTSIADSISLLGGKLNVAQSVFASNLDLEISNKTARANIEEVDYAEAVSELSKQEAALQAAQATFAKVTGLSLFDYIS